MPCPRLFASSITVNNTDRERQLCLRLSGCACPCTVRLSSAKRFVACLHESSSDARRTALQNQFDTSSECSSTDTNINHVRVAQWISLALYPPLLPTKQSEYLERTLSIDRRTIQNTSEKCYDSNGGRHPSLLVDHHYMRLIVVEFNLQFSHSCTIHNNCPFQDELVES